MRSRRLPYPLLILACSATKADYGREVFALDLYDGPAFRMLRARTPYVPGWRFHRVLILSAQHGLISPWKLLSPYDRRMDPVRAAELAEAPEGELLPALYGRYHRGRRYPTEWIENFGPYSRVRIWGGRLYRKVCARWAERGIFREVDVEYSSGAIGEQLRQLKVWLSGDAHE